MTDCTYEAIKAAADVCQFVKDYCETDYIPLYEMHYCLFEERFYFTIFVLLLILLICFYLLSDTSNRYLSPALTVLSTKLNMSQNLAGVTFLALGNGAPDVISSIVASSDEEGGVNFAVGALVGAGVFVSGVVLSSVVLFAKEVRVNKILFTRDILLYIAALGMLIYFSFMKKINLIESIIFFSLYVINVIVAFLQDKGHKRELEARKQKIDLDLVRGEDSMKTSQSQELNNIEQTSIDTTVLQGSNDEEKVAEELSVLVTKFLELREEEEEEIPEEPSDKLEKRTSKIYDNHFYENQQQKPNTRRLVRKQSTLKRMVSVNLSHVKYKLRKHYFRHKETKFSEKGIIGKIYYILFDFPTTLARDLTIPSCELERWNQLFFVLSPIFSVAFVLTILKKWELVSYNLYITIGVAAFLCVLAIIFNHITYRNRLPGQMALLSIYSFIMSIFWIWFVAQNLVDVLEVIGNILNVPSAFLGMTLLAFGNSAPDLSLNCALAKSGFGEMGIAGSIAGPLFNLLIGLGSSLIKQNIMIGEVKFDMFERENLIVLISIVFLAFNLIRLLVHSIILKFNLTRSVSFVGYIIYLGFLATICILTFLK